MTPEGLTSGFDYASMKLLTRKRRRKLNCNLWSPSFEKAFKLSVVCGETVKTKSKEVYFTMFVASGGGLSVLSGEIFFFFFYQDTRT